jgi:hypothetical protein
VVSTAVEVVVCAMGGGGSCSTAGLKGGGVAGSKRGGAGREVGWGLCVSESSRNMGKRGGDGGGEVLGDNEWDEM